MLSPPRAIAAGWRLLLCAVLLTAASEAAYAAPDGHRPADAVPNAGMPPYYPRHPEDEAAVRSLSEEMIAAGRAQAGTRMGGDLLFSAAYALARLLHDKGRALPLYAEAVRAYPAGDPTRAIALYHQAREESWRGHVAQAEALLAALEPWSRARAPSDLEPLEAARWGQFTKVMRKDLPQLRADVHKANGRFAEAADALRGLLDDRGVDLGRASRTRLWEKTARLRMQAGDQAAALHAVDAALEGAEGDAARAELGFWKLHAKHGLIGSQGAPALSHRWPGEDYRRDVWAYLHGIQGVEGCMNWYMQLGSNAFLMDQDAFAVDIYLSAMRDPSVLEAAYRNQGVCGALLVAYAAAMRLGRFDDAERILDAVEKMAGEPIPEMPQYRIEVREGRAEAEAEDGDPDDPEPGPAPEEEPPGSPPKPLGRIETEPTEAPAGGAPGDGRRDGERTRWPWIMAGGLLALAAWGVLRRRSWS